MSKTHAIHSDYFVDFREIIEKKEKKTPITEEKQIAYMANTPGWKLMAEYIRQLIDSLDLPAKMSMEGGCSYEEIGRKTIVAQLTKEFLQKVLEKAEDAKEATENTRT